MSLNKIGKPIVTQQMVADAVDVHLSTVSLALRNDPRLPERTRRRIQDAAKRLGYTPNPLVSILLSRVRRRNSDYRGTLGYVHTTPIDTPRLTERVFRNYIEGAQGRASELGYHLDEFALGPTLNGRRLVEMLRTRNILGLVVEHMPGEYCPDRRLPFDISTFAVTSLGVPLADPHIHYVANDQYMRAVLAAREALALGYRRLGLVVSENFDTRMAHRCSAGFWAVQEYTPGLARLPICHLRKDQPKALRQWLKQHRPDVVLGTHHFVLTQLQALGKSVPGNLGWVHLDWVPEFKTSSGVYGNSDQIGAAAVELVVSQLHRGETGPRTHGVNYFVSGTWQAGKTLRRVGPALDLDAAFFSDT